MAEEQQLFWDEGGAVKTFAPVIADKNNVLPDEVPRLANEQRLVLERLQRGPVTNVELVSLSLRYGARIHELRQLGYQITTKRTSVRKGVTTYTLEEETA